MAVRAAAAQDSDFRSSASRQRPPRLSGGHSTSYARLVRLLRIVLPTIAAVLMGLVVLWPQLDPREDRFRIGFADMEIVDDGLSMISPRYVGTDRQERPFSIAAHSVRNVTPDGEEVFLNQPEAEITLEGGAWVSVGADTGIYRVGEEVLELSGMVRLFHDEGYALETPEAVVDLDRGEITSSSPVEGQGPTGYLQGTGFRVREKGARIHVTGPARMTINPSARRP